MHKLLYFWLIILIFISLTVRFIGLESTPLGFYADESATAAQVLCVSQTGHDFNKNPYPLLAEVLGGGYVTPGFLYGGAIWVKILGSSIYSFRSFSAFITLLTILGLWFFCKLFLKPDVLFFILLTSAFSAWGFHFARLSWDPILMPCFLIWGLYFFFKSDRYRDYVVSGILISLALYTYPPARLQIPLMSPFLLYSKIKLNRLSIKNFIFFILTLILVSLPLILRTISGELLARTRMVTIFTEDFLSKNGGYTFNNAFIYYLKNLAHYFSPKFLFVSGDPFLRHSIGATGLLSFTETGAIALFFYYWLRNRDFKIIFDNHTRFLFILGIVGLLASFFTAATTNEYHPHTLRAIGGWPFLSIITGIIISYTVKKSKHGILIMTLLSTVFLAFYLNNYFKKYPNNSAYLFDTEIVQAAQEAAKLNDWSQFDEKFKDYYKLSRGYFYMHYRNLPCSELPTPIPQNL